LPIFASPNAATPWTETPQWPARWISLPEPPQLPFVAAYRLDFELGEDFQFRAHVTGDERYESSSTVSASDAARAGAARLVAFRELRF
jgi:hypothetical protein